MRLKPISQGPLYSTTKYTCFIDYKLSHSLLINIVGQVSKTDPYQAIGCCQELSLWGTKDYC